MLNKTSFLTYHNAYSWTALILLVAGEFMAFSHIQGFICAEASWALGGIALLILLMAVGLWIKNRFIIKSVILTKLLANAISPSGLGTAYLLLFVIHIGWITNVAMSLFLPNQDLSSLLVNVGVCLFGLFVLTVFFPYTQDKKEIGYTKVFVSGISTMSNMPKTYSAISIRPLVRILQLADNDEPCEMLIIQSEEFVKNEKYQSELIYDVLLQLVWNKGEGFSKEVFLSYSLDDRIRIYIREIAKKEFPEKKTTVERLEIHFSNSCHYDKFEPCFNAIKDLIHDKDDAKHKLIFNLTPGTKLVTALITLHAIDAGRDLYYYSQDRASDIKDGDRLQPIMKNRIPLHNILSQALEKIETQEQ